MPQGVLSLLKLKTMNFTDQVKALLVTGRYPYVYAWFGGVLEINSSDFNLLFTKLSKCVYKLKVKRGTVYQKSYELLTWNYSLFLF